MSKRFKRFKKRITKVARAAHRIEAKVGKVAIPIVATAVSVYAGPAAGAAFAGAAKYGQYYVGKSAYRGKHLSSHEVSQKARADSNRTLKYSMLGVGAGAAAAGVIAAAGGASLGTSLLTSATGLGGSQLLGIGQQPSTVKEFGDVPLTDYGGGGGLADQGPTLDQSGKAPYGTGKDEFGNPISLAGPRSAGSGSSSGGGFFDKLFTGLGDTAAKELTAEEGKKKTAAAGVLSALGAVPRIVWLVLVVLIVLSAISSGERE